MFDVVVVGQGIVGLGQALAAARAGMKVAVVDRNASAIGASIRNFGFVTVTGQAAGEMWSLARRARDIWAEVAPAAGVPVLQTGLSVFAHRPEAVPVLEAFAATRMGEDCALMTPAAWQARFGPVETAPARAVLYSPHEIRIEPREAIPRLRAWLAARHGVTFLPAATVHACEPGVVETSAGAVRGDAIFVCPGDDLNGLYADVMARRRVTRCKLHMLRLSASGGRLPTPVMADLSLARYEGYAELPAAEPLKARLAVERAEPLAAGVHLIVVQSADGSLVVGDTHEYGDAPTPFQPEAYDQLILDVFDETLPAWRTPVVERWIGVYASSPLQPWFCETVAPGVKLTVVTCGAGMSTAFAIGERVVGEALGLQLQEASLC